MSQKTLLNSAVNKIFWILFNFSSSLFGVFTAIRWPRALQLIILKFYSFVFRVNLSEAAKELSEYDSLTDFFIRELKPGLRPIEGDFISPIDGTLRNTEIISAGMLTQVKGKQYAIDDLLGTTTNQYEGGYAYNFYLSPKDYHRIHAPFSARVTKVSYFPGMLYPVNTLAFNFIPSLFVKNERVVIEFADNADGRAALVLVGAMNVGKIKLSFADIKTNQLTCRKSLILDSLNTELNVGQELGRFELGSACALLLNKSLCRRLGARIDLTPGAVRMGQKLSN